MLEEKKKGKIVFIIILIIIILGMGGYIYYTDFYNPKVKTITKTKVVEKSTMTSQISEGIARQTYSDYSNIWDKFTTTEGLNEKTKQISNYTDIMEKYYTKDGKEAFELLNKDILTFEGDNAYITPDTKDVTCTIGSLEFEVSDFNSKNIEYKVTEKKYCNDGDESKTQDVKTNISDIKVVYKNKMWKIDTLEVGKSN